MPNEVERLHKEAALNAAEEVRDAECMDILTKKVLAAEAEVSALEQRLNHATAWAEHYKDQANTLKAKLAEVREWAWKHQPLKIEGVEVDADEAVDQAMATLLAILGEQS